MDRIPMAKPLLGAEEEAAAVRVIRSGWVMQGPEVLAFEREFAAWVSAPFACAVSSGTAALHLALYAVGVQAGDEVVTVSHSHIATANSIKLCGGEPVFVDIERDTFNASAAAIEAAMTPKTRAILCVHQMGMPSDLAAIAALAKRKKVALVEDAACAAGSEVKVGDEWQRIGRPHGDVACFSFHPRKLITTGDGGMVTTRDAKLDERVRRLRQHAIFDVEKPVEEVGFNYRLSDVQAAIGRVQLERLAGLVVERRRLAQIYREAFSNSTIVAPQDPTYARSNWQTYCVRLPDGVDSVRVRARLSEQGIATRTGIMNAHEQPAYAYMKLRASLVESEAANRRCLTLPMLPGMSDETVREVAQALIAAVRTEGKAS